MQRRLLKPDHEKGAVHPMSEPELIALAPDEPFRFACGPGVSCFNQCCRDLNQALTPYDVLRIRRYLHLSWDQFLKQYAVLYAGPASGLPVVSLRFPAAREKCCPFVTAEGCSIYAARPTSCRLYPVARALTRSRGDGRISQHFALIKEDHCLGFAQGPVQTVLQWIEAQDAREGLAANDRLMDLIALKNRLRPGRLDPEQQDWAAMALYDPDRLRQEAVPGRLQRVPSKGLPPWPEQDDDEGWVDWGLIWVRQALFGAAR
jgi:uncharacterized protein